MRIKIWLKYLVYILLLILLMSLAEYINFRENAYFKRNFQVNYFYLGAGTLINVGIGLLLGLESFIREMKREGVLKVNLPKLILGGLPFLYLSSTYFLMYSYNSFIVNYVGYFLVKIAYFGLRYVPVSQMVLGFILITSFYKENKKEENRVSVTKNLFSKGV